ncbi:MAG TPA: hypothetical protein VFZ53_18100 [Polyangiaceae bacterium]
MPLPAVQVPHASRLDVDVSADVAEESVRDDDWPASDPSADDANAARAGVSVAPPPSSGPTVPSDADWREFRGRQRGKKALVAVVASAAALVVAGVAWTQFASPRASAAAVARAPERRVPDRPPEPRPTQPALPAVTSEAVATPAPAPEAATGASPEKAATTVLVTIKTVPMGSVIFRAGERLGTGGLEVSVERDVKQRFTALHDGYVPSNFTLDGSRDSVTIRLKRAPKREAPKPDTDVSPGDESSLDSSAGTAVPPTATPEPTAVSPATAAPAPASAPASENGVPAPRPDVSSPVTPD